MALGLRDLYMPTAGSDKIHLLSHERASYLSGMSSLKSQKLDSIATSMVNPCDCIRPGHTNSPAGPASPVPSAGCKTPDPCSPGHTLDISRRDDPLASAMLCDRSAGS